MKILMVCTGNTCRSSMAEVIIKQKLKARGLIEKVCASSAGTATFEGLPATDLAQVVVEEQGLDLSQHHSQRLTKEMIQEVDLILAMTRQHKDLIVALDAKAAIKTFTLKEYAYNLESKECLDIPDPFGQPVDIYRKCFQKLDVLIDKVVDHIVGGLLP